MYHIHDYLSADQVKLWDSLQSQIVAASKAGDKRRENQLINELVEHFGERLVTESIACVRFTGEEATLYFGSQK